MAAEHTIDALGQFKLTPVLGTLGESVNFTQSNLMMVIAGALTLALLYFGMRPRAIVPGHHQRSHRAGGVARNRHRDKVLGAALRRALDQHLPGTADLRVQPPLQCGFAGCAQASGAR